jgi:hypothetical protein
MKRKDIHKLLEKFYEGETSEQEESLLKEFFEGEEVPEELIADKLYFQSATEIGTESLDHSFDDKLMEKLEEEPSKNKFRIFVYSLSGIAATIAVFLVVWFTTDLFSPKVIYGNIEDPAIAFNETRKALNTASSKLNKGLTPAKKTVDKVDNKVQKAGELKRIGNALDKVKKIEKLDNTSDFLKSFSKVYVNYGNS